MSQFTEKHKNDLKLLLDTHTKTIANRLPKYGDAFTKRVLDDLQRPFEAFLDKVDAIRASGRYSPEGTRAELRLAARAATEQLAKVRADTVTKLDTQITEQRAAALTPKPTTEPLVALLTEMRHREWRDHLRKDDPLTLHARIRQAEDTDLLDALAGAPAGFSIAPPELIAEARTRIAEQNHPELGELAQLGAAYRFALGAAEQTILAASGLTAVEVATDSAPPARDTRPPVLLSTGQPVPA